MTNLAAIILAAVAFVQPTGERTQPPAGPDTKQPATPEVKTPPPSAAPAPLTETERPLAGRWSVDLDSYVKLVKERPQDVGLPSGVTPEQIAQQLATALPVIKTLTFELRADRSALLLAAGAAVEGTWHVEGESVLFEGPKTLKNFGIHHAKGVMTLDVLGVAKGIGLKAMKPGKTVTTADLQGEWTLDIEASVKLTRAFWEDILVHMPPAMKEHAEQMFKTMPDEIAKAPITFRFEADKAVVTTGSMPAKESTYTIFNDMILVSAHSGLKSDHPPEAAMSLFAEGETLRVPLSSIMGVLKKTAAKTEPVKPPETPSK